MSARGSGVVVLRLESGAKGGGVRVELRVALLLVRGGLSNGGLSGDASIQVGDLVLELVLSLGEAVHVLGDALFLALIHQDGRVVLVSKLVVGILNVLPEGLEELDEALNVSAVDLLSKGKTSKASKDGSVAPGAF